jgi:outer membrane protein assembly factor BamB
MQIPAAWLAQHIAVSPASTAAMASLVAALASGQAMNLAQQETFLDQAIANYGKALPPPPPPPAGTATALLSWENPATSAGSNIYQGASPGSLVKVATVAAGTTEWDSPPLPAGVYYFAVTNLDNSTPPVESFQSAVVSAQISPGAAQPVQVPSIIGITITLT